MSNADKLKRRAVEFESKRQVDRAIAAYLELFAEWEGEDLANIEVSLYNRAGDLMLREGRAADAIGVWERAVDLYADGGFLNNAIALCNKILRYAPNQTSVYYKLGRISAHKGFRGDAKKNFLEYADRKQRANDLNEALRALKEFADLCPEEDDIRQMVADQLTKLGRPQEALEQLQLLFERYEAMGDDALAAATLARMRAIDPTAEPTRRGPSRMADTQGLVFLDLDDAPAPRRPTTGIPAMRTPPVGSVVPPPAPPPPMGNAAAAPPSASPIVAPPAPPEAPPASSPLPFIPLEPEPSPAAPEVAPAASQDAPPAHGTPTRATAEWMVGFEPTRLVDEPDAAGASSTAMRPGDDALLGLEPTAFDIGSFGEIEPEPMFGEASTVGFGRDSGAALAPSDSASTPDDHLPPNDAASSALDVIDDTTELPPLEVIVDAAVEAPTAEAGSPLDVLLDPTAVPAADASWDDGVAQGGSVADASWDLPATEADEVATPLPGGATLDFIVTDDGLADEQLAREASPADPSLPGGTPLVDPAGDWLADAPVDEQSLQGLAARVERDPSDWWSRRLLGERLLAEGAEARGVQELEWAMEGLEGAGDLVAASDVAELLGVRAPSDARLHQKRVEYAVRTSDRPRLIEAYLALAGALHQSGQVDKARVVYARVAELAPDDARPAAALRALDAQSIRSVVPGVPTPAEPRKTTSRKRYTSESQVVEEPPATPAPEAPVRGDDADFVSLGDWLREDDGPKSTRMVVDEEAPSGDEDADFRDMLRKFKQGVADNVDEGDHESHYDLGVAFKEMGLVDEAIAQFQKALRGASHRVRTYEALGQCFIEKGQTQVAMTILQRALSEPGVGDDQLVGVLYLLGDAASSLGRTPEAIGYFQRVFAVDIMFRDVGDRLNQLERGTA